MREALAAMTCAAGLLLAGCDNPPPEYNHPPPAVPEAAASDVVPVDGNMEHSPAVPLQREGVEVDHAGRPLNGRPSESEIEPGAAVPAESGVVPLKGDLGPREGVEVAHAAQPPRAESAWRPAALRPRPWCPGYATIGRDWNGKPLTAPCTAVKSCCPQAFK